MGEYKMITGYKNGNESVRDCDCIEEAQDELKFERLYIIYKRGVASLAIWDHTGDEPKCVEHVMI